MIFKTFDSNIDKWTSKIGILGKSFYDFGSTFSNAVNSAFEDVINNIDNFDEDVGLWESFKKNLANGKNKDYLKNSFGEIISSKNIDSYIAELNPDSAKDKLQDILAWQDDIQNSEKTWQDYFNTLDDEKYIIELIQNTDDLSKLTGNDLVKANQKARASALAHNEALKQQTLGAKASKVTLQALSAVGNMLAMWAISEVISGITAIAQSAEKAAEKAKELGSEFSSTKSDIEGYKTKISELHETINDNSSSIYEVTEARRNLLQIQDEMIEKYGSEKGAISDITTAINGQADALDNLVQKEWLKTKNQFNDVDFWGGTSNFLSGYADEMERMNDVMNGNAEQGFFGKAFSEFFNPETYIRNNPVAAYVEFLVDSTKESMESGGETVGGSFTAFIDYIKKRIGETENSINKANYKGIQVNIGGLPSEKNAKYADLRQTLENAGYKDNIINGELVIQGDNLKDVYKQILRLQKVVDDLDVPKEFARDLSEQAKDIQKNLSDYNAIFNQQVLTEEVLPNEELSTAWKDAQKAYSEYETALISGDEDAINAKSEELAAIFNQIAETGNQNVIDLFNDLFPDLQSIAGQWNFEVNLKADGGALEKDIKNELDKLDGSKDGNIGLSSEDILNFDWKTASEEKKKLMRNWKT